jgi:hypothetical protein
MARNPFRDNFLLSFKERGAFHLAKAPRRETSSTLSFAAVLILIRICPSAAIMNFPARPDSSHTHTHTHTTQTLVIVARQSGRGGGARCLSALMCAPRPKCSAARAPNDQIFRRGASRPTRGCSLHCDFISGLHTACRLAAHRRVCDERVTN